MAEADDKQGNPFLSASTLEVAQAFGVRKEAVFAWKNKIPREAGIWRQVKGAVGRGGVAIEWDLPRLIQWFRNHDAQAAAAKAAPVGEPISDRAMSPLEREQLRKLKQQNDAAAGLLVDKLEMDRQWAKLGGELRTRLETVGRRHGLGVANDLARAMSELERSIHGLMGVA